MHTLVKNELATLSVAHIRVYVGLHLSLLNTDRLIGGAVAKEKARPRPGLDDGSDEEGTGALLRLVLVACCFQMSPHFAFPFSVAFACKPGVVFSPS